MKNKSILLMCLSFSIILSGCAQMRYSIQEGEHQYIIRGDIKSAQYFAVKVLEKMGYGIDTGRNMMSVEEAKITGIIVHPQIDLGNRVASTVLNSLFAPAPKKDKYGKKEDPTRKVVDHYEDMRHVTIKKRWDSTGEKLIPGELGIIVEGGKYGKNGQGEIVEADEINWDNPDRANIGMQVQNAINAYRAKYRK
jgi:hypothetical protein